MTSLLSPALMLLICYTVFGQQTPFNPGDTLANCISVVAEPKCDFFRLLKGFRTVDGTCNNLEDVTLGAANTPLARLVAADYVDGIDTPRGFPQTIPIVPTARQVSDAVFRVQNVNIQRARRGLSAMFMAFGQLLDHDIGLTTHPSCDVSAGCGSIEAFTYPCFPILRSNTGKLCTSFPRSFPVCQPSGQPQTTRQQINVLSSYLDLGQVYSNDLDIHNSLRQLDGTGLMRVTSDNLLPVKIPATDPECNNPGGCALVGDERGDENIALHTMHTIFVRNHNYLAKELKKLARVWDEKLLFETARKINIAIWQRMVYDEFLPNIVDLSPYQGYNTSVDPSILNVFSTAAFRFGHSLIPNAWAQLNNAYEKAFDDISLQASFSDTRSIRERGIEPTAFGLLANQSQRVDATFAFGIIRRLFVPVGETRREDLTALNIQRGRDHGLPTYGAWRNICNLPAVNTFDDLVGIMPNRTITNLKNVYRNPNDIDIFAAGMAERRTNGKMLGPTFQCIQRIQFERLRDGDRFFYEREGVFTTAQKAEIRKMTLSKVLCNTLNGIVSIQENALQAATSTTIRKSCDSIPGLDFNNWLN
ncbi:lactoperoxidase-like [Hydractinia symbiolongicarpus]|uniref:lactoperoxidase-like n=1 Tax=Hydractinia symbiolongicarpus TaxID=13093 RepID=UPI00254FDF81|nr:lactoperoxidase-like [Hydractinia symbiolongicarpus]